jgi:acyl-CoA thioesterase-1
MRKSGFPCCHRLFKNLVLLIASGLVIPSFSLLSRAQLPLAQQTTIPAGSSSRTILFFGNSLTAGFGLDPAEAFPALIQQKIDSLKWNYAVVNAGLSGETSAGGLRRIDWLLQRKIDILVLELGANDGLRGLALADTRRNLQGIIDRTKQKHPHAQIVIAGMQVPPNLGSTYTQSFRALFPELAKKNEAVLIPFLLKGVGGVPALNLADGIHPNIAGHRKVAENVWQVLRPLLAQKK